MAPPAIGMGAGRKAWTSSLCAGQTTARSEFAVKTANRIRCANAERWSNESSVRVCRHRRRLVVETFRSFIHSFILLLLLLYTKLRECRSDLVYHPNNYFPRILDARSAELGRAAGREVTRKSFTGSWTQTAWRLDADRGSCRRRVAPFRMTSGPLKGALL